MGKCVYVVENERVGVTCMVEYMGDGCISAGVWACRLYLRVNASTVSELLKCKLFK